MSDNSIPVELVDARAKIDAIDAELLELLAGRFELTHQVGLIKAAQNLDSLDAGREAEKLSRLRELSAELGLDPELVTELFTRILQEVVKNHEKLK